jgi:hypothetical protein
VLDDPIRAEVERFMIERMRKMRNGGYEMTVLDGRVSRQCRRWSSPRARTSSTWHRTRRSTTWSRKRDGLVGWGVLDDRLRALDFDKAPAPYPIFKMRREIR